MQSKKLNRDIRVCLWGLLILHIFVVDLFLIQTRFYLNLKVGWVILCKGKVYNADNDKKEEADMKRKPYHSKNGETLKRAILEDAYPVSLIALELRSITPGMTLTESERLAGLLLNLADACE